MGEAERITNLFGGKQGGTEKRETETERER